MMSYAIQLADVKIFLAIRDAGKRIILYRPMSIGLLIHDLLN
jgi:hypothetical protein